MAVADKGNWLRHLTVNPQQRKRSPTLLLGIAVVEEEAEDPGEEVEAATEEESGAEETWQAQRGIERRRLRGRGKMPERVRARITTDGISAPEKWPAEDFPDDIE